MSELVHGMITRTCKHPDTLTVFAATFSKLQDLVFRHTAIGHGSVRGLAALQTVENWQKYVLSRQFPDIEGWELQNLLTVSHVIIRSALDRSESRGVHLRLDFPESDDENWLKHVCFEGRETIFEPI